MGIDISQDNNSGFIVVNDNIPPMPIIFINPLDISCIKLIDNGGSKYQVGIVLSNSDSLTSGKHLTHSEALFAIHEMLRMIPKRNDVSTEIPETTETTEKTRNHEKQNHTDERMKNIEV
jgi:hypothetical protein